MSGAMESALNKLEKDCLLRIVLNLVIRERERQDGKWGKQRHDDEGWKYILKEELAEFECARYFKNPQAYKELVEVAAVAVAWLEQLVEEGIGKVDELKKVLKE